MELNGQVHERQYTIEKNKLEIQALKDQDQMAQAHIGRLNGLLAEKEQQMEQAASQNRETVAALEQRIAALRQAGSDQEAVIAQLQQSLSEVTGSTAGRRRPPSAGSESCSGNPIKRVNHDNRIAEHSSISTTSAFLWRKCTRKSVVILSSRYFRKIIMINLLKNQ